jgi:hypothetical protein
MLKGDRCFWLVKVVVESRDDEQDSGDSVDDCRSNDDDRDSTPRRSVDESITILTASKNGQSVRQSNKFGMSCEIVVG